MTKRCNKKSSIGQRYSYKEADKGWVVVIMDKQQYLSMLLDILNDQNYYERLESNRKKVK